MKENKIEQEQMRPYWIGMQPLCFPPLFGDYWRFGQNLNGYSDGRTESYRDVRAHLKNRIPAQLIFRRPWASWHVIRARRNPEPNMKSGKEKLSARARMSVWKSRSHSNRPWRRLPYSKSPFVIQGKKVLVPSLIASVMTHGQGVKWCAQSPGTPGRGR